MKEMLILNMLLIQSFVIYSQTIDVKTDLKTDDIFLNVTYLTESPNYYDEKLDENYAFRFIVTSSEIYEQIYVEKVTYGEEGSKQIDWRKKMDMDSFYKFGITGEITNIKFKGWSGKDSFKTTVQEIGYEVSDLSSEKWILKRKN